MYARRTHLFKTRTHTNPPPSTPPSPCLNRVYHLSSQSDTNSHLLTLLTRMYARRTHLFKTRTHTNPLLPPPPSSLCLNRVYHLSSQSDTILISSFSLLECMPGGHTCLKLEPTPTPSSLHPPHPSV